LVEGLKWLTVELDQFANDLSRGLADTTLTEQLLSHFFPRFLVKLINRGANSLEFILLNASCLHHCFKDLAVVYLNLEFSDTHCL